MRLQVPKPGGLNRKGSKGKAQDETATPASSGASAESEGESLVDQLAELQRQLKQVGIERDGFKAKLLDAEKEKGELQAKVQTCEGEIKVLKFGSAKKNNDDEAKKWQQEKQSLTKQLTEAEGARDKATKELEKLQNEVKAEKAQERKAQTEKLKNQKETLTQRMRDKAAAMKKAGPSKHNDNHVHWQVDSSGTRIPPRTPATNRSSLSSSSGSSAGRYGGGSSSAGRFGNPPGRQTNVTGRQLAEKSYGKKMTYAEQLQAEERARGEEVLKNNATITMRSQGQRATNESVVSQGRGMGSYAEQLQAMEKARGEEVIKNNAKITMRSSSQRMTSDVVVSSGKRYGYAEQLQAKEAARGEEVIKNNSTVTMRSSSQRMTSDVVVSSGKRYGYAEQLQAEEAARGEQVIKNDSTITMRSSQLGGMTAHGTVEAKGKGMGSYAEQLQAQEAARGEEVLKNNSTITMRSSQLGGMTHGTVEAKGKGMGSYAEQLQAQEAARGEEVLKNNSTITMRSSQTGMTMHGTVEASGKGLGGEGYAERLQRQEMERGEEIVKNDATTFRSHNVSEGIYDNYRPDEEPQEYDRYMLEDNSGYDNGGYDNGGYDNGGGYDEAPAAEISEDDAMMLEAMDEAKREELQEIMKDKSLGKVERSAAMEEVRGRYEAMRQELLG